MKKLIMIVLIMVFMFVCTSFGADLALKVFWTPNTDTVTIGYKLYRTDGTRVLVGTIPGKTTSVYPFIVTVPDESSGILTFVLTAYSDTKESGDSVVIPYPFDLTPIPTVPAGGGISKQ